jgi:integrase
MFEYAVERSILDASPLWGIKKMYKTTSRDRVLDNNEIKYFWNNFATVINCSKVTELTLKTMLATGQRSGEVRHMKTEDLNYQNLIWTIPASISKNKKEHRVPLSPLAIELIREAYQLHKKHDYIFSSPVKPNEPMDRHAIARPVANFSKKGDIEKFTPHDLRRTFTTHCTRNGLRRDWIKYVLNHSEGDVTAVYDKYEYDDEKKSILDAWAGILLEIINSGDEQEEEKTDVVNFLLVEKEE